MTKAKLAEILTERPFRPIVLHMTNGRTPEIHHPENAIVADEHLALLAMRDNEEVIRIVSLPHITESEPLPSTSA
ncbi:MAG: hypothetical protein MI725_03580 [Pirellulales bacterium]|nr:hypothetical protein [Pirellulales bacterium]